jgi:hypothetical protein
MLYLALATTGVKCLTKCGNISRLPVAAVVRIGLGQGNPRTPRRPASRAASAHQLDHLWAERGRVGWSCLYHHGLERNVPLSTKPGRRIYWTHFVTMMSREPIGLCYGRWRLAARPRPRAL